MSSRFDFPSGDGSEIALAVYVPSTRDEDIAISEAAFERRVEETEQFLSDLFGGSTAIRGTGTYTLPEAGLVEERVTVVETFADAEDYDRVDKELRAWLMEKKQNWGQDAMGFEFEEEMYFV